MCSWIFHLYTNEYGSLYEKPQDILEASRTRDLVYGIERQYYALS